MTLERNGIHREEQNGLSEQLAGAVSRGPRG
jgi:hypothetical protein